MKLIGAILLALVGVTSFALTSQVADKKLVSAKLLGFPYQVALNRRLVCYVGESKYLVRESVYKLDEVYFTSENLEKLFRWESNGKLEQELAILVVSSEADLEIANPSLRASHINNLAFNPVDSRMLAQYYRAYGDEVFWFSGSDTQNTTRIVVLSGKNPYNNPSLFFSFIVVRNNVIADQTEVECVRRDISILLRPCDFSTANLIELFKWLAEHFPQPTELIVTALPDHNRMENSLRDELGRYGAILMRLMAGTDLSKCPVVQGSSIREQSVTYYRNAKGSYFYHYRSIGPSRPTRVEVPLAN